MVTDRLANAGLYRPLSPRIAAALDYVIQTDLTGMPDGRHNINGDELFVLVQRYRSKTIEQGRWEAHRKYIDLQVVVTGEERIGYISADLLAAEPYDAEKDLIWLSGAGGQWIHMPAGHFMIMWPGDAHMPGVSAAGPADVLKAVVKIAV